MIAPTAETRIPTDKSSPSSARDDAWPCDCQRGVDDPLIHHAPPSCRVPFKRESHGVPESGFQHWGAPHKQNCCSALSTPVELRSGGCDGLSLLIDPSMRPRAMCAGLGRLIEASRLRFTDVDPTGTTDPASGFMPGLVRPYLKEGIHGEFVAVDPVSEREPDLMSPVILTPPDGSHTWQGCRGPKIYQGGAGVVLASTETYCLESVTSIKHLQRIDCSSTNV